MSENGFSVFFGVDQSGKGRSGARHGGMSKWRRTLLSTSLEVPRVAIGLVGFIPSRYSVDRRLLLIHSTSVTDQSHRFISIWGSLACRTGLKNSHRDFLETLGNLSELGSRDGG